MTYDQAQVTADTTTKLWELNRKFRVDRVQYVNPTGLAVSDTNYFILKLTKDATVIASWSTKTTGGDGALVADTFVDFTMSGTDANLVLSSGDEIRFFLDETGTATLPAGRLIIEGRYVE